MIASSAQDLWPSSPSALRLYRGSVSPVAEAVVTAMFDDEGLLATRLRRHAIYETAGARVIESAARVADRPDLARDLRRHAADERRHGRIFGALAARIGIPAQGAVTPRPLPDADESGEAFDGSLPEFLASTHAAEVRSLYLLDLYTRCAETRLEGDVRARVAGALRRIRADEGRHVAYTYARLQDALATGALSAEYIDECFRQFCRRAWWELASTAREAAEFGRIADRSRGVGSDATNDEPCSSLVDALASKGRGAAGGWALAISEAVDPCSLKALQATVALATPSDRREAEATCRQAASGPQDEVAQYLDAVRAVLWDGGLEAGAAADGPGGEPRAQLAAAAGALGVRAPTEADAGRIARFAQSIWRDVAVFTELYASAAR